MRLRLESSRMEASDFMFSRSVPESSGEKEVSGFLVFLRVVSRGNSLLMILIYSLVILVMNILVLSMSSS